MIQKDKNLPSLTILKRKAFRRYCGYFYCVTLAMFVWSMVDEPDFPEPANATQAPKIRALKDTVGFAHTPDQIQRIVAFCEAQEKAAFHENAAKYQLSPLEPWIAAICPHDDHLLAGPVYVHPFQNLSAKRFVIFGVAHKAKQWGLADKLIFDSFAKWKAPYGEIKISNLRDDLLKVLSSGAFVVCDSCQAEEHSVEGIVPFIQHYNRQAEIVSILVPYMSWPRTQELSEQFAAALAKIVGKNRWKLGRDLAFICSNDGDHYGDQDWSGQNYAPFGADECGHRMAIVRDSLLAEATLAGNLDDAKLESFYRQVWGDTSLYDYKIRWCGRFAIPFGLSSVNRVIVKLQLPSLHGYLLRYDTSFRLGKLPLAGVGLGTTAPNNIHHWVGYSAIGYR